ncbi:MAG: nuclease [Gammaproteobacteria bacterium RIFCSPHIGHO2_12_FULL_37_14]|nr:MAG: nuclease [Gammaproteobacteria bacterium RIFCSPHIGHO2_12_FULL_37_14]
MDEQCYWVYILHCENGSYYTGYTNNLNKRYLSHLHGTGNCKYTRSFKPLCIAQCWKISGNKSLAMQIEHAIKKLPRSEKEQIISQPSTLSTDPRVQPFKISSNPIS